MGSLAFGEAVGLVGPDLINQEIPSSRLWPTGDMTEATIRAASSLYPTTLPQNLASCASEQELPLGHIRD
jgi:hypothetical protein